VGVEMTGQFLFDDIMSIITGVIMLMVVGIIIGTIGGFIGQSNQ